LISIFPHQAQPSSCKIGSGSVSPHCFPADIVKCGPGYRHKCQIRNKAHLVGRHVDLIRDASGLKQWNLQAMTFTQVHPNLNVVGVAGFALLLRTSFRGVTPSNLVFLKRFSLSRLGRQFLRPWVRVWTCDRCTTPRPRHTTYIFTTATETAPPESCATPLSILRSPHQR
jgi:hypothetical protein